jgi:TPR repeat protein
MGVLQDYLEAAKWLRKAADQGDASAQYNLGIAYAKGDGVAKNEAEALKWIRMAAEQGDLTARNTLQRLGQSPH